MLVGDLPQKGAETEASAAGEGCLLA
jgi:hypothetical protein